MIDQLNAWVEKTTDIEELVNGYREIEVKEKERTKVSKALSDIKTKIKTKLDEIMINLKTESLSTKDATVFSEITKHVTTDDKEEFLKYIRRDIIANYLSYLSQNATGVEAHATLELYLNKENINDICHIFTAKPYGSTAVKELVKEGDLPPGLKYYDQKEIRIRKK